MCGCTETNLCWHPQFGTCGWADKTHEICTHCVEFANDGQVINPLNHNQVLKEPAIPVPTGSIIMKSRGWNSHYLKIAG